MLSTLNAFAKEIGADRLLGAIVFCSLDRPIDAMIRLAQKIKRPSGGEWSHTFIIAGPYRGEETLILDCTIRDSKSRVDWGIDLRAMLRGGGIYAGKVGDYQDARVFPVGVKWLPEITIEQRWGIVGAAAALQAEGFKYDVPGLIRELIRLGLGVSFERGEKLLFCSAFCAEAYRLALGTRFSPLAIADETPDDLWYSPFGEGYRL